MQQCSRCKGMVVPSSMTTGTSQPICQTCKDDVLQDAKLPVLVRKPAHAGLFAFNDGTQKDRIQAIDPGLLAYNHYFVKQRKEWVEIVTDYETRNKYDILDPDGVPIGHAAEHATDKSILGGVVGRLFLGTHRSFTATIWDQGKRPQLEIKRPFYFLLSDMFVHTADGARIGSIHRRFHLFLALYDIKDNRGRVFARIKRPFFRLWKFSILDAVNRETGQINKRWAGLLKEVFSSSDTYEVNLGKTNISDFQRAVLMAATIAIDFDYFEKQSKN